MDSERSANKCNPTDYVAPVDLIPSLNNGQLNEREDIYLKRNFKDNVKKEEDERGQNGYGYL
jgi:hypothetical protein